MMKLRNWYPLSIGICLCIALMLLGIAHWQPASASPEYLYTTEWLARYVVPPLIFYIMVSGIIYLKKSGRIRAYASIWLGALGLILIGLTFSAPGPNYHLWYLSILLSLCWTFGFISLGLACFLIGDRTRAIISGIACLFGAVFLSIGIVEGCLLCVPKDVDGMHFDNRHSAHVLAGKAEAGETNLEDDVCGFHPSRQGEPRATAHKFLHYDTVLYDVKYDFDKRGRRPLPESAREPEFDLLLFGCSFTFGHGLETTETWPWKLALKLGQQWKVENYSYSGYSANQMLCLLEHNLIEAPEAPVRYALFLGIGDHVRRNETFPRYPHYQLGETEKPVLTGKSRFVWLYNLPETFHGSQLARQLHRMGMAIISQKYADEFTNLYVAQIEQSSVLLKEKYKTTLIVMLWPDLESIAPQLQKAGIPIIFARNLLSQWKECEQNPQYMLYPPYENHPNSQAGTELAAGLAQYFQKFDSSAEKEER